MPSRTRPRRSRKPGFGKEIKASLRIDKQSLADMLKALRTLALAARREVVEKALLAGGNVAQAEMQKRAPGPYIEVEFVRGGSIKKGTASGSEKKAIQLTGVYVAVGPDSDHWYYKFTDSGTKAHGVTKRKRTRMQQHTRRRDLTLRARNLKPAMAWKQGGRWIFTRKVRGMSARPFMQPAMDAAHNDIMAAIGQTFAEEFEKAKQG